MEKTNLSIALRTIKDLWQATVITDVVYIRSIRRLMNGKDPESVLFELQRMLENENDDVFDPDKRVIPREIGE